MKTFVIPFQIVVPVIEVKVDYTYFPVKKPSGINYMFLVLMKDYPNKQKLVQDVLFEFGLAKDVFRIVAEEIEVMIKNDVILCTQGYQIESFLNYNLSDFHFTTRGEEVFERQFIQIEKEKEQTINVYYTPYPFQGHEREFTLKASNLPSLNLTNLSLWSIAFQKAKINDIQSFRKQFDRFSNAELGLQNQERVGQVSIKEQNVLLATTTVDMKISDTKIVEFHDLPNTLKSLVNIFYTDDLFKDLVSLNIGKRSPLIKAEELNDLNEVIQLRWADEPIKPISQDSLSLIITTNTNGNDKKTLTFESFFSHQFAHDTYVRIDRNQQITRYGKGLVTGYQVNYNVDVPLVLNYEKIVTKQELLSHLSDLLKPIDTPQSDMIKAVYTIENAITDYQVTSEWILFQVKSQNNSISFILTCISLIATYPAWKSILQQQAIGMIDRHLSSLQSIEDLSMFKNYLTLAKFANLSTLSLLEQLKKNLKSSSPQLIYEKLVDANLDPKDVLIHFNPLSFYLQQILNNQEVNPVDKLTIELSKLGQRFQNLKSLLKIEKLTDIPFDDGLDYENFLKAFSGFLQGMDYLKSFQSYMPNDEIKTLTNFQSLFNESAIYARFLKERERSNTVFTLAEVDRYVKEPSIEKLRTIVIELTCIVEELGKTFWKDNSRATLEEHIQHFYDKKVINQTEKTNLHQLRLWRVSLVHPTERVKHSNEELRNYAELVLTLSQKINAL